MQMRMIKKLGRSIKRAYDDLLKYPKVGDEVASIEMSKLLYFIDFHPHNSKKKWIHQDYMNSL